MACFADLYRWRPSIVGPYIEHCRAIKSGVLPGDGYNWEHLEQLDRYECAERGDFDYWLTSPDKSRKLILYACENGRCDIIERYLPRLPDDPHWNHCVSAYYKPSLYPILSLVMPLPVTLQDAARYVYKKLHREAALHIVGRASHKTGKPITLESIVLELCRLYGTPRWFLDLEGVGLDLSSPNILYTALHEDAPRSVITLLHERCEQSSTLDSMMPNGKTLREMVELP